MLKEGRQEKPGGVEDEVWDYAVAVAKFCDTKTKDKHYRVVQTKGGGSAVMMLDADGNLPKVALTSPWLSYLNYSLCGVEPFSETRHATVCTPYIFNKYKGIFGLTGSVGGKAELTYLGKTYKSLKFDVPRFLDTCTGDARKIVMNHGVEVHDGEEKQIERVCEIAGKYFKQVPVLIITASLSQVPTQQRPKPSRLASLPVAHFVLEPSRVGSCKRSTRRSPRATANTAFRPRRCSDSRSSRRTAARSPASGRRPSTTPPSASATRTSRAAA